MRQFIIHTLVILGILFLGMSPFIVTMIAGTIAEANGCTLHEGFVNPCIINGKDYGEDLYTFGMLGWLAIGTIPLAVGAALIYLLVVIIVNIILYVRRRNAAQQVQPATAEQLPPQ
jgi:hypothetical protein